MSLRPRNRIGGIAGVGTLVRRWGVRGGVIIGLTGCIAGQPGTPGTPGTANSTAVSPITSTDTSGQTLVPAGFGSLRQDDIAMHVDATGVLIRAVPLDESVIRLLTPDSYRALRDLQQSNRAAIASAARRYGARQISVWLVSFYGLVPDARFTPFDLHITSNGREFRAYDVIPLTVGFGEQRLRQRETQNALYLFDGDINLDQLVTVTYQGSSDESWEDTLQRIERERALVRARAGRR